MFHIRIFTLTAIILLLSCAKEQDYWSDIELRKLQSMQLSKLVRPNSLSNRLADDQQAAQFGQQLFFDKRLSMNGELSCASCHLPELAFTDGKRKAEGLLKTGRNTQTILGASFQSWFYWDGRKDSLWSQAIVPFEAADEMASNRIQVLRIIGKDEDYRQQFETLFGPFPTLIYQDSIPENAGPWGDKQTRENWFRIKPSTKHTINKAYANVGKAIAAYMHSIPVPVTRFDQYLEQLFNPQHSQAQTILTQQEIAGLKLFLDSDKTHCLRCHNGPLLSNSDFHNIGSGSFSGEQLDFGRYLGVLALKQDEFNCLGNYSDAKANDCQAMRFLAKDMHDDLKGAFKTPTLRYLNKTGPYFHDGRHDTVKEVLSHYLSTQNKDSELPALSLTQSEQQAIVAFLNTLNHPD